MRFIARILVAITLASAPALRAQTPDAVLAALRASLTFHASFDHGLDADFAVGDRMLYSAASFSQGEAKPGVGDADVLIAKGQGRFGDALQFRTKNTHAVFFKAERNVAYRSRDWSGTVSFWLSLSPDKDLEPGYTDPLQLTDKAYNNAAIWVDFTRDDAPRHFRFGAFGDLAAWNPNNLGPEANPFFNARTIVVTQPPFTHGAWTHVAITFENLNSDRGGWAKLYLNGKLIGTAANIREPFTWDVARASIRLGVNYVGLWDDLSLFNRALSDTEIDQLFRLDGGAARLHK